MKAFFLWVFCFIASVANAQGVSNHWLMGYASGFVGFGGININFDSIPIVATHQNRKMNFEQSNSSISDKWGKLLFYTNGSWIANAKNDTMVNGRLPSHFYPSALSNGASAPQISLILPNPSDSSIYYLFYETLYFFQPGFAAVPNLLYAKIDMKLDSGKGVVTQKAVNVINDTLITGQITACKHGNGRDWWVTCHRYNSNKFYVSLLTSTGISTVYAQNIGDTIYNGDATGQSVFSPDGKKFAMYNLFRDEDLNILDFDRCSGTFSNPIHVTINDSAAAGGVAFSPNSRYLYVSSTSYVYQFDMQASNIDSSKIKIATYDGFYSPQAPFATTFYLAQLASNGKIYINSTNGVQALHVINHPDSAGLACNLVQHGLALPAYNAFTIPNFPNYFSGADSGSLCDTLALGINNLELRMQNEKLAVYPNPVQDNFQLQYTPSNKTQALEIVDVNGKVVIKRIIVQGSTQQQIDVSKLPKGIYVCKLQSDSKISSCKFVKVDD